MLVLGSFSIMGKEKGGMLLAVQTLGKAQNQQSGYAGFAAKAKSGHETGRQWEKWAV